MILIIELLFHLSLYSFRKYIDFSDTCCNHNETEGNKFAVKSIISSTVANPYKTYYNSLSTLREFRSEMDFGDKECQVVVRAKMEAKPINSSCNPTLKLQLFSSIRISSKLNHTGIILTTIFL